MSKKLINDPKLCVEDFIEGLTATHSGLIKLPGHQVILRHDLINLKNKVALLSGGGAGHEPAHAGYIGLGMLTGAISGAVFTSPPPSSIYAAIEAVQEFQPSGILLIVKNYTGDRINFGLAKERALANKIKVDIIFVGEDCALGLKTHSAGRRGLAGTVLVHKVAGALAEKGECLENIVKTINNINSSLGTIGVCLHPCILPGMPKSSFELGADEIELGLGIHGEAGIRREKILMSRNIVDSMMQIMTDNKSTTRLSLQKNDRVVLLLNNLGGTSNLEMGVFGSDVLQWFNEKGITVLRTYSGAYMTSLQMAGASITVLKTCDSINEIDLLQWLDMETHVAAPLVSIRRDSSVKIPEFGETKPQALVELLNDMSKLDSECAELLKKCIESSCNALIKEESTLNEYDTGSGDGDCGITHTRGSRAILEYLKMTEFLSKPATLFSHIASICSDKMGGSSGAMYSIFMTTAARHLSNEREISMTVLSAAFNEGLKSVKAYGGAKIGDRTMVDTLEPVIKKLMSLKLDDNKKSNLISTSQTSANATITMKANLGRASYVNESLLVHPDPGAYAVALIVSACAGHL